MACAFWAARDWLLGKSRHERRLEDDGLPRFPTDRVARLLWTLTLSAGALSLAGILQRLDGTAKLLWIFRSPNLSDVNFGPYPYRGNAAQFLNLMWPLALGFWWALRDRAVRRRGVGRRAGGEPHVVLLPLAGLIAAGNFLTASRGGVLILAALLPAALLVLLTARGTTMLAGSLLVATVVAMVAAGWFLGGNKLLQRFATVGDDKLGGREPVYESAARMEKDFRVWGSGAETFAPLLHLYRKDPNEQWHAYAHDDYLETRITFGLAGFGLILALLVLAPVTSVLGPGIPATREFILLLLVAMGGILVHARFDLPFQIYSLHFEFVALSALLSCVNGVSRARTA
jgi:hypothetical protein